MDQLRCFFNCVSSGEIAYVSAAWLKKWANAPFIAVSSSILPSMVFHLKVDHALMDDEISISSTQLMTKYGYDITIEKVNVKSLKNLPAITQLTLLVPPSVYQILNQRQNSKYIIELVLNDLNDSIVRKGSIIKSVNGEVILSEPFPQGLIDLNTNVLLVKGSEKLDYPELKQLTLNGIVHNNEFSIKTIHYNSMVKYSTVGSYMAQFPYEDPELFVCMHYEDLIRLDCLSGDILELVYNDTKIYARVFPFLDPTDLYSEGSIYISPTLDLQFNNSKMVNISKYNTKSSSPWTTPLPIPLAMDVTISRIATNVTLDKRNQLGFLAALKRYFQSHKRVITLGQIVPISFNAFISHNIDDQNEGDVVINESKGNTIACFQITSGKYLSKDNQLVDLNPGEQYYVSPSKSTLTQKGLVSNSIMLKSKETNWNDIASHLGLPNEFTFNQNADNTFSYAKELRKIFQTAWSNDKAFFKTTVALYSTTRSVGKSTLVKSLCNEFGSELIDFDCNELSMLFPSQPAAMIAHVEAKTGKVLNNCSRVVIYLRHLDTLCKVADGGSSDQKVLDEGVAQKFTSMLRSLVASGAIVICSCLDIDGLNEMVRSEMVFEIEVKVPNDKERVQIYDYLLQSSDDDKIKFLIGEDVSIQGLSMQSAALTPNDMKSIVKHVKIVAMERLQDLSKELKMSIKDLILINGGGCILNSDDFENSINSARSKFSDSIGAPRIPNVKWEDVGGLDTVKDDILDTIEMPLKHPELFGSGMKKRSGILFYGPPGTGKTLLAKAIASNFSLNFFSVKGPELLNMYIGESEANVRRVFQRARDARPCVVFFDELDSVAPKRGNQGDAGGVMDRIVSQLLAELDGMSDGDGGDGVFVVGASNRPDLLDEALLRPGRFDKLLYLGISDTHEKQAKIIEALSRKFPLSSSVDLISVANRCPFNFTGADFYALCSDALLLAMGRSAKEVEAKVQNSGQSLRRWFDTSSPSEYAVEVTEEDFDAALRDLNASVSPQELAHYERIRDQFST